jgi:23S rRNA (pseudouridine1915-N3)-methyltransferase
MRIYLISVARRVPPWVRAAYEDYAVRLPARCALGLIEVTAERRRRGRDTQRPLEREGERVLKAIPPSAWVVALDEHGERWGTADLARRLADWQRLGRDVALLVGGSDGLDPRCLGRADQCWSLSPLTLPHGLVRVILAEQIYRAQSLLDGHPYHRG